MLRDENRMAAHRRLAAVVHRFGGRETPGHEIACVLDDDRKPAIGEIGALLRPKPETATKRRAGEPSEDMVEIAHRKEGGTLDAICQRR